MERVKVLIAIAVVLGVPFGALALLQYVGLITIENGSIYLSWGFVVMVVVFIALAWAIVLWHDKVAPILISRRAEKRLEQLQRRSQSA